MKTKFPLAGIIVSLNTPFDRNGRIDFESLHGLIEYHLQAGAAGFLSPAQAGEVGTLSFQDRRELVTFVRSRLDGRAFYVAGATADNERHSFLAAESAVAAGCSAVLVEAPAALRTDRAGIMRFFRDFASIGMPLLMIQDLDWGGPGLDIHTILQLFEEIDSFQSLKVEVSPAGPKYTQIIEATSGNLHVCGGWAAGQMIEALDRGVDVFMPTAMTRSYRAIFDAHRRGDRHAASAVFQKILPVLAFSHQHLDISIQFYKRLFVELGIFSTVHVRKACLPYDSFHQSYGRELIRYLKEMDPCDPSQTISRVRPRA